MSAKKTKKAAKAPKTQGKAGGEKSVFQKWLEAASLRPAVVGDTSMAARLHSLFVNDSIFECFDLDSLFDYDYRPNLLILVGPLSGKSAIRILKTKERLGGVKVIYVELLLSPGEEPGAVERARSLGADVCLAKEFVTMENIKEAVKRVSDV